MVSGGLHRGLPVTTRLRGSTATAFGRVHHSRPHVATFSVKDLATTDRHNRRVYRLALHRPATPRGSHRTVGNDGPARLARARDRHPCRPTHRGLRRHAFGDAGSGCAILVQTFRALHPNRIHRAALGGGGRQLHSRSRQRLRSRSRQRHSVQHLPHHFVSCGPDARHARAVTCVGAFLYQSRRRHRSANHCLALGPPGRFLHAADHPRHRRTRGAA